MKPELIRTFFCLAIALCIAAPAWAQADGQADAPSPNIHVPEPTFDFGAKENIGPIDFSFDVFNTGAAELHIAQVKPACGCTAAELDKNLLAPDESVTITGTLNLPKRNGPVSKTMTVYTNDPDSPAYLLKIQGTLVHYVHSEPQSVLFQKIGVDEETTQTATIKSEKEGLTFSIKDVEVVDMITREPSEHFSATVEPVEDGREYTLAITTTPPLPNRPVRAEALVHTDADGYETINVPITAAAMGPIVITPETLLLPEMRDNQQPLIRNILIRPGLVEDFQVLDVEVPDDAIEVNINPKPRIGYLIELRNVKPSEALDGTEIIITTDAKGMEEVVIPVKLMTRQAVPGRPAPTQ